MCDSSLQLHALDAACCTECCDAVAAAGPSALNFKTVLVQPAQQGCHAEVADLEPGTEYSFQVYAVNSQGASPASSTGGFPISLLSLRPLHDLQICC